MIRGEKEGLISAIGSSGTRFFHSFLVARNTTRGLVFFRGLEMNTLYTHFKHVTVSAFSALMYWHW
uniref:Uncharacterized protein n=1 Tax=Arundo donax TaxID=35708 RepID=A0A0A8ZQ90_ARUDO